MSSHTVFGVSVGTLIGLGGAATDVGDIPSLIFLSMGGVDLPGACLAWMKNPLESVYLHPCSPITDPASLGLLSNVLVFIAIVLIIWGGIEILGNARNV